MLKLFNLSTLILLTLITKFISSAMVLGKQMTFDQGVSHASVGFTEITFFTKTDMNSMQTKVTLYDFQTNTQTIISPSVSLASNKINSPTYFKNTPTSNYYSQQQIDAHILSFNLTYIQFTYNASSVYPWTKIASVFGKQGDHFLNAYSCGQDYSSGFVYDYYQGGLVYNSSNQMGRFIEDLFYEDNKFIYFFSDSWEATFQLSVQVMVEPSLLWHTVVFDPIPARSAKWACSSSYIVIYFSSIAMIFKFNGNVFNHFLNITISGTVDSLDISNEYLVISGDSKIKQYQVSTGILLSTQSTPNGLTNITVSMIKSLNMIVLWKYGNVWVDIHKLTPDSNCFAAQGCTCPVGFCFDKNQQYCFDGQGQPCPTYQPQQDPIEPIEPIQPTTDSENSFCYNYSSGYCQTTCSKQCETCLNSSKTCLKCAQFYEFNENEQCQMPFQNQLLIGIIAIINLFKITNSQSVYCFFLFDGIELYNFHKLQYGGIFSYALQYLDFIQDNIWSMIPFHNIIEFLNEPLFPQKYNAYTNPQFLQKRRNDSLFFQNTKKYFIVALPLYIFAFLILNRLFWILSKYKISVFLRNFSFWLQLGMLIGTQNISLLNYYFLQNISMFFSINSEIKIMNFIVLFLYGILLIFCFVFLPLSLYFYKNLSIYFLNNCKIVLGIFIFSFLKYMFRPVMQGFIHVFLYEYQTLQLSLLALSSLLFLCMSFIFEIFLKPSDNKLAFSLTCILDFILFLFNSLLIAQITKQNQLFHLIDQCIGRLMYIFVGCAALLLIHPIINILLTNIYSLSQKCKTKRKILKKQKQKSPLPLKTPNKFKIINFDYQFQKTSKNHKISRLLTD